jgi:hypothetical protein
VFRVCTAGKAGKVYNNRELMLLLLLLQKEKPFSRASDDGST